MRSLFFKPHCFFFTRYLFFYFNRRQVLLQSSLTFLTSFLFLSIMHVLIHLLFKLTDPNLSNFFSHASLPLSIILSAHFWIFSIKKQSPSDSGGRIYVV